MEGKSVESPRFPGVAKGLGYLEAGFPLGMLILWEDEQIGGMAVTGHTPSSTGQKLLSAWQSAGGLSPWSYTAWRSSFLYLASEQLCLPLYLSGFLPQPLLSLSGEY